MRGPLCVRDDPTCKRSSCCLSAGQPVGYSLPRSLQGGSRTDAHLCAFTVRACLYSRPHPLGRQQQRLREDRASADSPSADGSVAVLAHVSLRACISDLNITARVHCIRTTSTPQETRSLDKDIVSGCKCAVSKPCWRFWIVWILTSVLSEYGS